jgi:hypothetical protein
MFEGEWSIIDEYGCNCFHGHELCHMELLMKYYINLDGIFYQVHIHVHQISIKPNFNTSWKVRIHMTYIKIYFQHSLISLSSIILHQPLVHSISEFWSLQKLGLFFSKSKNLWEKLVNV